MPKKKLFFLQFVLLLFCDLRSQSKTDFNPNNQDKQYADYKESLERNFNAFQDSIDREFTKFLSESWKQFNLSFEPVPDVKPKPIVSPVIKPAEKDNPVIDEIKPTIKPAPISDYIPKDDFKDRLSPEFKSKLADFLNTSPEKKQFNYHGLSVNLFFNRDADFTFSAPPDNKKVTEAWHSLSILDLSMVAEQMAYYATKIKTNDWGLVLMIKSAAKEIYPDSKLKQNIFTWFLLNKMGYKLRLAYDDNNVYLLIPTTAKIFENSFLTIDGICYYIFDIDNIDNKPKSIFTYGQDYNVQGGLVDFYQIQAPVFNKIFKTRNFNFTAPEEKINFTVVFDSSDVSYYNKFPFLDFNALFKNSLSDTALFTIQNGLAPYLAGKTELQKVNILLRFLQYGFQYKTDEDQFGYENYLYPEESLFYPYNDCEDRAFLFSYLVSKLLKLEVVGLDFPGHVATAVHFNDSVTGDFVDFEGKRYLICDPTYIGADAGMCMPNYKTSELQIIRISH
jgi:hypothetical protein